MNLQLANWRVYEFQITEKEEIDPNDGQFNLDYTTYAGEKENDFFVKFEMNIVDPRYTFYLVIAYRFTTDEKVTDEFLKGKFANQNAPAIAFPYVRAYISNVTLQSGFHPVILPSVNFVRLYKKKIAEETN